MKITTFHKQKGVTLIEVILFIMLLSILITGFIQYAYAVNQNDFKLMDEINDAHS